MDQNFFRAETRLILISYLLILRYFTLSRQVPVAEFEIHQCSETESVDISWHIDY